MNAIECLKMLNDRQDTASLDEARTSTYHASVSGLLIQATYRSPVKDREVDDLLDDLNRLLKSRGKLSSVTASRTI